MENKPTIIVHLYHPTENGYTNFAFAHFGDMFITTELRYLTSLQDRKDGNNIVVKYKNSFIEINELYSNIKMSNPDDEFKVKETLYKNTAKKFHLIYNNDKKNREKKNLESILTAYQSDEEYLSPAVDLLINKYGFLKGDQKSNVIAKGYWNMLILDKIDGSEKIIPLKRKIAEEPIKIIK